MGYLLIVMDKFQLWICLFTYCRTRFKGFSGLDIVEINLSYFTTITDSIAREKALNLYPKGVKKAYQKYTSGSIRGGVNGVLFLKGLEYIYKFMKIDLCLLILFLLLIILVLIEI